MKKTVYVFIDASNLWQAQKIKGKMFDYEKLQKYLRGNYKANYIKTFYYTAYPAQGTREYSLEGRHKFYTYLKKALNFTVQKKELKQIVVAATPGSGDVIQEKGNMDVEMTIDAVHHKDKFDEAVFFTGDSDFLSLVNYLRNNGKEVYVYSSRNNISKELRTGSSGYVDVLKISHDIWGRDLRHRENK